MSRIDFWPESASFSNTTRRIFTFSGTAKFISRSWHSATSYLCLSATLSPQLSQKRTWLGLAAPQCGQETVAALGVCTIQRRPQALQVVRRCSMPSSCPHLHSQLPMEYCTNSSEQVSLKSEMGNTDFKNAF